MLSFLGILPYERRKRDQYLFYWRVLEEKK